MVLAIVASMALSVVWAPRLLAVTSPDPQDVTHVVRQGDTLWDVARLHASERIDPRAVVDQIRRLNGLSTAQLFPGQELKLPPQG
ncbi:MAG: LysM peptidoglycan-binding domain-containing protein [Actinobacteria bacterium]|nr:LysM peptidoglycan-binding domain-containing protein [Actinomycetota bacterium]